MSIDLTDARTKLDLVRSELHKVFVGCDDLITCLLLCFISTGLTATPHMLIVGKTGTGKSRLSSLLAPLLGLDSHRIDGTAELLPSDIVGYEHLRRDEIILGPVFTNFLHVDEINRFHPRTRAALLTPMAERKVTIQKITYELERPFFVVATENPASYGDAAPLRLQERDRFFLSSFLDWPSVPEQIDIIDINILPPSEHPEMTAVFCKQDLLDIQEQVARTVYVDRQMRIYGALVARQLVPKFSDIDYVRQGEMIRDASIVRGARDLIIAGRSYAFLTDSEYVAPEHLRWVAKYAMPHRIDFYTESLECEEMNNLINEACFQAGKKLRVPLHA